jgi:hypothetical protein
MTDRFPEDRHPLDEPPRRLRQGRRITSTQVVVLTLLLAVIAGSVALYSYQGSEKMDNTAKVEGSATTGSGGGGQSNSPPAPPRITDSNVPPAAAPSPQR